MKKYLFLMLLLTSLAYSQDTVKVKPNNKNHIGVSISPAIIGDINTSSYLGSPYLPLFATSFYIEYNRVLSKRIWLTGGVGVFTNGHYFDANDYYQNSGVAGYYSNYKSFLYNYNFSIQLKPKFILIDKKILFYIGLSSQMNFYLTSFSVIKHYDNNNNLTNTETDFNNQYGRGGSIYGGVISGIGYNHKRFLFVLEPEFKVSINSIVNNYSSSHYFKYIPYSLGINLLAYYKF